MRGEGLSPTNTLIHIALLLLRSNTFFVPFNGNKATHVQDHSVKVFIGEY
jgi:hypothetical protein